jgi:hypothetical protein
MSSRVSGRPTTSQQGSRSVPSVSLRPASLLGPPHRFSSLLCGSNKRLVPRDSLLCDFEHATILLLPEQTCLPCMCLTAPHAMMLLCTQRVQQKMAKLTTRCMVPELQSIPYRFREDDTPGRGWLIIQFFIASHSGLNSLLCAIFYIPIFDEMVHVCAVLSKTYFLETERATERMKKVGSTLHRVRISCNQCVCVPCPFTISAMHQRHQCRLQQVGLFFPSMQEAGVPFCSWKLFRPCSHTCLISYTSTQ